MSSFLLRNASQDEKDAAEALDCLWNMLQAEVLENMHKARTVWMEQEHPLEEWTRIIKRQRLLFGGIGLGERLHVSPSVSQEILAPFVERLPMQQETNVMPVALPVEPLSAPIFKADKKTPECNDRWVYVDARVEPMTECTIMQRIISGVDIPSPRSRKRVNRSMW